ncbi:MAG: aldo/keto reductase family protein [Halothermotrichaceae bacterium]
MKYRNLGKTGLKISEISLGSWLTYGNSVEKERAEKIIDKAYELGINSFDTANVYAKGEAEKVVGKALNKYERDSYVLATKAFWPMGNGPNDRGLSRKHIYEQLHQSLNRLNHDYVDIYYCHRFDENTPLEETLRTIEDMIRQGKVLYVGVSEWTAAQIVEGLRVQDKYLLDHIVVNQPQYNMFHRNIEKSVVPTAIENGIGIIPFSPLAEGLLTGKYRKDKPIPEDSRAADPDSNTWIKQKLTDKNLERVEELIKIAGELEISMAQLALAWVLHQPGITSALIGASRPKQVEENVKAVEIELTDNLLEKVNKILK